MLDEADLETNVLEFRGKSFSFDRTVELGADAIALFHRTETESESRFRPKVIRLHVALPRGWIVHDLAAELNRPALEGRPSAGPPGPEATEAAAEPTRFEEGGIARRRHALPGGAFFYVPEPFEAVWLTPASLAAPGII